MHCDVNNTLILCVAPTGPPTDVTATSSGNSITVSWSPVPCLLRNSEITGYVVHKSTSASTEVSGSVTSATIDGLKETTLYSIEVAAVGAGGTGVFSDAVTAAATAAATAEATTAAEESEWLEIMALYIVYLCVNSKMEDWTI